MIDKKEFQQKFQKIEKLIQKIESAADSDLKSSVVELMQIFMELHGAGLERMLEIVFESDASGSKLIDDLARDSVVESLLLLYDLHPLDFEMRVEQALEQVRPYLQSHGGNAELLSIADGVVHLRMIGSCNGCPSSSITLKQAIEKAIMEAAPETISIVAEGAEEKPKTNGFVQIKGIQQAAIV